MKSIGIFVVFSLVSEAIGTPWIAAPREDEFSDFWYDLHNSFVENTQLNHASVNVLFYGDSITWAWNNTGKTIFDQYYLPLGTANYAIPGDETQHILYRHNHGEVTELLNPKLCVLKIGTNNLARDDDVSIATGITFVVLELREKKPDMKILLLGVLPRNNEELTNRTVAINDIVGRLDNGRTIRYLDMKEHFWNGTSNSINRELYDDDLLHLNENGYRKWQEVMHPLFQEMLESS